MPLSEFYRMAKGKLDSTQDKNTTCSNDLSFVPENDFVELVWENGQILMQGQSSRTRKPPTGNSLLPSHIPKPRDSVKYGKFGTLDCAVNEFQMPGPSGELGLNQDDDMVPWLNYPIDESLQHGYCSDFMPELSGVTGNEVSAQNQLSSTGKRYSGNLSVRSNTVPVHNGVSSEQGNVSKVSCAGNGVAIKPRSSTSHLYPSSPSQQCQTSYPSHRSKVSDSIGNNTSDTACRAVSRDSPSVPQKQDPVLPPSRNSVVMNFSHFSRPAALVKANVQSNGVKSGMGLSGTERKGSKDKASVTSGNNVGESRLLDSSNGLQKETSPSRQPTTAPQKVNLRPSEDMPLEEPVAVKQSEFTRQENDLKDDKNFSQIGESSVKGPSNGEKVTEPVVVCSSVCSGNSIDRPSDDATHNSKRKSRDNEDSECPSEDAEEESMDVKRAAHARAGTSSKRSRAAEVHNLSERRRRDRINEKMRSLQELIPNCNKVDKASMLDEAIEYLKTLQLQVQIMSMGAGLYMPQMMFPPGMQQLHAAHMGHFSPMVGMGMGMGIGMGMHYGMGMPDMNGGASGCPMIQVPPIQGAHFPGPPMSGSPSSMNGMAGSNLQLFGPPSQGIPMSMPRAPSIPLSGDPPVRSAIGLNPSSAAGPMQNVDSSLVSRSKDLMLNINSQAMQTTCINSSMNQTSSQCRATQKDYEPSALVQNNGQVADVKAGEAVNSSK